MYECWKNFVSTLSLCLVQFSLVQIDDDDDGYDHYHTFMIGPYVCRYLIILRSNSSFNWQLLSPIYLCKE